MKTFDETLAFIEKKAIEQAADESDWAYEFIELAAFSAIMEFSLSEGFSVACCDLAVFIQNARHAGQAQDEDEDEDDGANEKNAFWQMNEICEEMNVLQDSGGIPPKTRELYGFWQRRFWPDFYDD